MNATVIDLPPVHEQLGNFATSESFWTDFELIIGTQYDRTIAENIKNQWLNQDFSNLPTVQILSSDILGNANGAYAISNNTIYLSDLFLANATQAQITAVLLEEIGHLIDANINVSDTPGDEGELFARLVLGEQLNAHQIAVIKQENVPPSSPLMVSPSLSNKRPLPSKPIFFQIQTPVLPT